MDLFPDAVFIDAGSNFGLYTLAVAAMNRLAVAVDMMEDNFTSSGATEGWSLSETREATTRQRLT